LSGRALFLREDILGVDELNNFLVTATQEIYKNDTLLHRFKHFSSNNAPNIFYATECLLDPKVRAYLQRFDVTEDWPLQVAIARQFPGRRYKLIDEVLVYYRRTVGSTYIVANKRFTKDKIKLYEDLIVSEDNLIERIRLVGRKYCFNLKGKVLKKILNLDFYFFTFSSLMRLKSIYFSNVSVKFDLNRHTQHYKEIKKSVKNMTDIIDSQATR
jgi:hypothetical protein